MNEEEDPMTQAVEAMPVILESVLEHKEEHMKNIVRATFAKPLLKEALSEEEYNTLWKDTYHKLLHRKQD